MRSACRFHWAARLASLVVFASGLPAGDARAELRVGAAKTDITPPLPVALAGQFNTRIAKKIESPVMAAAVAIEKVDAEGRSIDQAIMVTCDLVAIREGVVEKVRNELKARNLDGLEPRKVFLSATHTHTAPVMREGVYRIPDDVIQPTEYVEFLAAKVADIVEQAWSGRQPGAVSWGLGHAVVAQNRRIVYANGNSQMYGSTGKANFKGIEGYEDHGVEVLFFWSGDDSGQPAAIAVNVACPAQEVESRSAVNADYWHPVRAALAENYGADLVVLTWIGAAGDQSPHLMLRKAAEQRMLKARGLTSLEEISRRIVAAVDEAFVAARDDRHADPPLQHHVADLELPKRMVTEAELAKAEAEIERLRAASVKTGADGAMRWIWNQKTVDRFAVQENDPVLPMEMHAIRLGDVAICTNRFELYTEYGIRLKGRSKALQTFVVQLAGPGSYLATEEAEAGGGYSAIVNSCQVGPRGGDVLVEETLQAINAMWGEEEK